MGLTTKEISSSSFNDMISSVDRRSEYVENRAGANVRLNNFLTPYTLDDKSSILNAPCGYSNGVYASLKPIENLGTELVAETPSNLNGWIDARNNITLSVVENNIRATRNGAAATIGVSSTGFATVIGKTYSFKIIGTKNNINGNIYARISNASNVSGDVFNENNATNTISVDSTFVATSTTTFIGILATGQGSGDYVQSSLMSVRELLQPSADFDFTRGSAATRVTKDGLIKNVQILSDELVQNGDFEQIGPEEVTNGDFSQIGSELVTNGDFATDSDWLLNTGWSISGGNLLSVNSPQYVSSNQSLAGVTLGKIYKTTINVNSISGDYVVTFGSGGVNHSLSLGLNTLYKVWDGSSVSLGIYNKTSSLGNISIDSISVKEVGQDWEFYNADADTNTRFENNAAVLEVINTQFTRFISTTSPMTIGKFYKVTYQVTETDGTDLNIQYPNTFINSSLGTHTVYIKATNVNIGFSKSSVGKIKIDNVSVKEVGQNWTFGTGWSMGDGKVVADGTMGTNVLRQYINFTPGNKYRFKYTISDYQSGNILIREPFDGSLDAVSANGTFTFDYIAGVNDYIDFRGNSFIGSIDNVSLIEVTDDTDLPRIDYTNGTGSLLLEPQSTNLALNSNDLTKSIWSKFNSTSESSNIINPEGTSGASEYVCNNYTGSNQYFRINPNTTYSSDVNYSYSVFVKYKTFQFCKLTYVNYNSMEHFTAVFDIINGIVTATDSNGTPQNTSKNIQDFGNGWFRISISAAITSSAGNAMNFEFNKCPSGTPTFTSFGRTDQTTTTSDRIYVWGAQLEQENTSGYSGKYATSYIPTSSSTVTRNADVCNNAGSSDLINSTEGVLYAEYKIVNQVASFPQIRITDSSLQNQVSFYTYDNTLQYFVKSNNINTVLGSISVSENTDYKLAISYSSAETSIFLNGVKKASYLNKNMPSNLEKLDIITSDNVSKYKSVAVFKEALTDEELAKITSTTQQEAFYEMRDKMLQIDADYYEFGDYTTRLKKLF